MKSRWPPIGFLLLGVGLFCLATACKTEPKSPSEAWQRVEAQALEEQRRTGRALLVRIGSSA
jgi:hypothetical protein